MSTVDEWAKREAATCNKGVHIRTAENTYVRTDGVKICKECRLAYENERWQKMPPCRAEGCEKRSRYKGYCNPHYLRERNHGTLVGGRLSPGLSIAERLAAKSLRDGSGCLVWTDHLNQHGYGALTVDGTIRLAHRLSFEAEYGPVPAGLEIDHMCHNRACLEPTHLRAVTREVNQANRRGAAAGSKTGVLNVHPHNGKFVASFKRNGVRHHVGTFGSVDDARAALQAALTKITEDNE
jgi:hypothetical protein